MAAILEIALNTAAALLNATRRAKSLRELEKMSSQATAVFSYTRIITRSKDEMGDLIMAVNQMIDSLRELFGDLT